MPVLNAYTLHAVGINSTIIDQVQSRDFQLNADLQYLSGDGKVDPEFVANLQMNPQGRFATTALDKALTTVGIAIDGLAVTSGLDFEFQKVEPGGARASTGHIGITYAKGLVVPSRLTLEQGQYAEIEYEVGVYTETATTAPHSISTSHTLSGSPDVNEAFTLGDLSLAGSAIDGVQRIEVDWGVEIKVEFSNGGTFPRLAFIQKREPTITMEGLNIAALTSTAFQTGQSWSGMTDSTFTAKKLANGGALAGSGDLTFTLEEGMSIVDGAGGGMDSNTNKVILKPTSDGTADLIAVA